jgi:hypothetical protein
VACVFLGLGLVLITGLGLGVDIDFDVTFGSSMIVSILEVSNKPIFDTIGKIAIQMINMQTNFNNLTPYFYKNLKTY